jgi:hypothetical protein
MRSILSFKSPLKLAKLLPSATQTFEEVSTPATWTEVIAGLSDPAYAGYYILQYHSTILDNHDFLHEDDIRDLRRRVFGFPSDSISGHLEVVGQIMRGDVGCRSDGTITLTQEPSLQTAALRGTRDSKFEWTETSVNPGGPMILFASKAPGNAQTQGVTKSNIPSIGITVAGGAAELYGVAGHMFALLNNPLSKLDVLVAKMLDIGDPADPDWHVLNISESTYLPLTMDQFGVRWTTTMRMRPTRVNRQWTNQHGSWVKQITQSNRIESAGTPGVFHPTYIGEIQPYLNPFTGWLDGLDLTMPDLNINFNSAAGGMPSADDWNSGWAFNDFGTSGISLDWNGFNPSYASVNTGLDGDVVAQAYDGAGGGDAYLLMFNDTGTTLHDAYSNPNIEGDPTNWSLDNQWNVGGIANMVSNASWTLIVWGTTGLSWVYTYKSTAGAWSAPSTFGSSSGVIAPTFNTPPPIVFEGNDVWTCARYNVIGPADDIAFRVNTATSFAGWSEIANHPGAQAASYAPIPMIKRSSTNIVVTYADTATTWKMYRVDDATSTWTDITPTGDYVPMRYNACTTNADDIWIIGTDPDGDKKIFESADNGDTWTDRGSTRYDWLIRMSGDDVFVLGGDGLLDVTNNDFGTFHSRLGQWASLGSVGYMENVASYGML